MPDGPRASQRPPTSHDPLIGTVVGGIYRVVGQIGEGGVGAVYRAEYGTARSPVALKVLHHELSNHAELVARFEREVSSMAGLMHPNIVRAFDAGRTPRGELYMVMELATGETVRTELHRRGGALPLPLAVALAHEIGAALTAAHQAGVVHRDLKPENVMVRGLDSGAPQIKVLDFGMARMIGRALPATALTKHGAVLGSPSYMSPEQAAGRYVDARADQYALGVMLFEMLAGRRPFESDNPLELLRMHVRTPPPPLLAAAPHVPPNVAAVVDRMLAKPIDERFYDVETALAALDEAMRAAPASVDPVRAARAHARRRAAGVASVVAVVVAVVATGYALWTPPAPRPPPRAAPARSR